MLYQPRVSTASHFRCQSVQKTCWANEIQSVKRNVKARRAGLCNHPIVLAVPRFELDKTMEKSQVFQPQSFQPQSVAAPAPTPQYAPTAAPPLQPGVVAPAAQQRPVPPVRGVARSLSLMKRQTREPSSVLGGFE